MTPRTLRILTPGEYAGMVTEPDVLRIANDRDVEDVPLDSARVIELEFPRFTDGRAYSQAWALRRRGFTGEIRAVGAVLIDQLLLMQRSGFSSAVLRDDQNLAHAQRQFDRFPAFYQGNAAGGRPHFRSAA